MIKIELDNTTRAIMDFDSIVNDLNTITVPVKLQSYIKNIDLQNFDESVIDEILGQQKFDKFSKVSNATELISLGINLSYAVPTCVESKAALDSILKVKFGHRMFKEGMIMSYVVYDGKQFVLNQKGKDYLENSYGKLNGVSEEIYKRVKELHKFLSANNKNPSNILNIACSPTTISEQDLYYKCQ